MIGKWLVDGENDSLRRDVNDWRFRIGLVFGNERLQIRRVGGVVGIQQAVVSKVRVKSDREQSIFIFDVNFFRQVEERLAREFAIFKEAHPPHLFDNQLPAIRMRNELDGSIQAAQDRLKLYFRQVSEARNRQHQQNCKGFHRWGDYTVC